VVGVLGGFVAGVVASVAVVVVLALLAGEGSFVDALTSTATYGPDQPLVAVELEQGQCAVGLPDDVVAYDATSVVPCDGPHDVEVYASIDVPIGAEASRPSDSDLAYLTEELCFATFSSHTSQRWEDSPLDFVGLVPSTSAWRDGERGLHCLLVGGGQPADRLSA
jgi:hypothetical protein